MSVKLIKIKFTNDSGDTCDGVVLGETCKNRLFQHHHARYSSMAKNSLCYESLEGIVQTISKKSIPQHEDEEQELITILMPYHSK